MLLTFCIGVMVVASLAIPVVLIANHNADYESIILEES